MIKIFCDLHFYIIYLSNTLDGLKGFDVNHASNNDNLRIVSQTVKIFHQYSRGKIRQYNDIFFPRNFRS